MRERVHIVDSLRAVAALSVLFNHLTTGLLDYPRTPALRAVGEYGRLGVIIFFVLSGFVIPYSLEKSGYALRSYGKFLLKRMIRIDVPCWFSCLLIVALGIATGATRFETPPRAISFTQVALQLGYLNYLFGYEFLNGVFWSLAIELQFYLVVALLFPLLVDRRATVRNYPFVLLGVLGLVAPERQLLFYYSGLFVLGMCTFQYVIGLVTKREYLIVLALATIGTALSMGIAEAASGLATALLVAFVRPASAPLATIGALSYSLYLIHIPISLRIMTYLKSTPARSLGEGAILGAAGLGAIAAAWLMWRWVERPSQRWASSIRY